MIAGSADFSREKYMDIIEHGESVLKNWFKLKGWRWKGYKEVCEPFRPYYELYPELPPFSNKIEWARFAKVKGKKQK
ncbi:hypothetical protein [Crocosphaera sp.]|uniref:hypothetical protein n=1 Tax=Crocosphaera sp. TaxID=2729996 RepID=UPI002639B8F9|nr:hypothetical protein [Crocosphaera sp.]MDJ0581699.1 hypothetical protein [Crocosphaera sp.]